MSCVLYKMVSLMSYVMYSILYRLFVAFFDNYNSAFHKTNSSGKTLDTRQKIFCGPLLEKYFDEVRQLITALSTEHFYLVKLQSYTKCPVGLGIDIECPWHCGGFPSRIHFKTGPADNNSVLVAIELKGITHQPYLLSILHL